METLFFIGKMIGTFVLIQFTIGPILVFISQKMPKAYRFNIFNSDDFLSKRTNTFKALHETIVSEGFEYIGSSEIKQSNSDMYFSIYNSYGSKLACTLSTSHSKAQSTTQIEFTQMYSDGSVVNINN
ncbi:MAG: hypothetical protein QNL62_05940, partial [Gammaproteobacteria bacterium]|nr:hypothetical protein [Gammaproteobacteria bacterium]